MVRAPTACEFRSKFFLQALKELSGVEGGLDQDGDRELPPDRMGVNASEDKGGVVLRHDLHVNEPHEFGLGKQVPMGKSQDYGLVEMAQA